ncbi:TPA: helix-turn-helix transcriptional regulator [Escherichia coli]|nr:helix-turn-helix transcriptional regulator [Escherichia coli]
MKNTIKRNGYADKSADKLSEKERIIAQSSIIHFGDRLKQAMDKCGFSHLTLSKESGLSETTIRKYVQGKIYPGIDSAALVAHACGVTIEWLLTGKSDNSDNSCGAVEGGVQQHDELDLVLQRISKEDRERLLETFYDIGIKGVLQRLQQPQEQTGSAEMAIRALNIRASLKDAICMALAGDESTDREILRRIESRNRTRAQGGDTADTPREDEALGKKQA